jgi:tripartite-type tricarboxylate transporter receptor subunit TctC
MKIHRKQFLHLVASAATLLAASRIARAQTYPARPVQLVVPLAPAGTTDLLARLMGQWLSERLGQQFIIEKRKPMASLPLGALSPILASRVVSSAAVWAG